MNKPKSASSAASPRPSSAKSASPTKSTSASPTKSTAAASSKRAASPGLGPWSAKSTAAEPPLVSPRESPSPSPTPRTAVSTKTAPLKRATTTPLPLDSLRPQPVEVPPATPRTVASDETGGVSERLESARKELRSTRKDGNMRTIRSAAEELNKAEKEHTTRLVTARVVLEEQLAHSEAERERLTMELGVMRERCAAYGEEVEEHRSTAARLEEARAELSAAHEELAATRTQLTLATNQLGGARLQLDTEVRSRKELKAQNALLRADAAEALASDAASRARIEGVEASRDELRLLRATLASKLEVKGAQLAEAQAQLRDARGEIDDLRPSLQRLSIAPPPAPAGDAILAGARERLEGLRDAQAHLRAQRALMRDQLTQQIAEGVAPRAAWERHQPQAVIASE